MEGIAHGSSFKLRNYIFDQLIISVHKGGLDPSGAQYAAVLKRAAELTMRLNNIASVVDQNQFPQNEERVSSITDAANALREFKSLLDEGIITQQEFEKKNGSF